MIIKILKVNKKSNLYLLRCDNCDREFERKYPKECVVSRSKGKLGKTQLCCFKCTRGKGNTHWKGGRIKTIFGYIKIYKPEHPYSQADGYVPEHRLIMEESLKRYLTKKEVVHHINGIRDDNRIENLELFPNNRIHAKRIRKSYYSENQILKERIKELEEQLKNFQ